MPYSHVKKVPKRKRKRKERREKERKEEMMMMRRSCPVSFRKAQAKKIDELLDAPVSSAHSPSSCLLSLSHYLVGGPGWVEN